MPRHVREPAAQQLELEADDVYAVDGPLGAADLLSCAELDLPDLKDPPSAGFAARAASHHGNSSTRSASGTSLSISPIDSFASVRRFLEQAAVDPTCSRSR